MTHTPGPWKVCRFDDGDIFIDGPSKARAAVCKMLPPCGNYTNGETYEKIDVRSENAANARLIASAPELLAACKIGLRIIEAEKEACGIYRELAEQIRAAIAAAEGRE